MNDLTYQRTRCYDQTIAREIGVTYRLAAGGIFDELIGGLDGCKPSGSSVLWLHSESVAGIWRAGCQVYGSRAGDSGATESYIR